MAFAKRTIPELAEYLPHATNANVAGRTGISGALHRHLQQAVEKDTVISQWERLPNRGHSILVIAVVFSPDGRYLASVDSDGVLTLWNLDAGERRFDFKEHRVPRNQRSITFSSDSRRLAAVSNIDTVNVWDVQSGALLYTLTGHLGPV